MKIANRKISNKLFFLAFLFSQFIEVSLVDDNLQIFKGREVTVLGYQVSHTRKSYKRDY